MKTIFNAVASSSFCVGLSFIALQGSAHAAITLQAQYHLGEAGSLSGIYNQPVDSSGKGRDYTTPVSFADWTDVVTTGLDPRAVGSTAALSTAEPETGSWYGASFGSIPNDNFAFGIFAKAASLTGTTGNIFSMGGNGSLAVGLTSTGWSAGTVSGTDTPTITIGGVSAFTANTWVHLAVIRQNGTTSFYVDGAQVGSSWSGTPGANGGSHLSINPGGTVTFDGVIDEARVISFDASETSGNILNALQQGIPEPSSALLGSLGLLGLLYRRSRK